MCDGNEQGMVSRASRTQNERKQTKKKKGSNTIETKLRVSNTVSKFMIDPTSKRVTVTPYKIHDRAWH